MTQPDLHNRSVTVVGGGPSLIGFDFDRIPKSDFVIGPNAAAWTLPRSDAFVTVDKTLAQRSVDRIRVLAETQFCVVALPPTRAWAANFGEARVVLHRRDTPATHKLDDGLAGLNSGYAAINLAYILGARSISLLGFDMQPPAERTHWHAGYTWHHPKHGNIFRGWAQQFQKLRDVLAQSGVRVVNYVGSDGSGITAFDQRPLDTFAASEYGGTYEPSI